MVLAEAPREAVVVDRVVLVVQEQVAQVEWVLPMEVEVEVAEGAPVVVLVLSVVLADTLFTNTQQRVLRLDLTA